jgi:hypothetical protein
MFETEALRVDAQYPALSVGVDIRVAGKNQEYQPRPDTAVSLGKLPN